MNGSEAAIVGQDKRGSGAGGPRRRSHRARQWEALSAHLALALGCLEDGHFLIFETRDESSHYVQFAAGGVKGMRVEAVSNRFLEGWHRLDATAEGRLRRLGWRPPTDIGDGPVNWWRSFDAPVPTAEIAELAVTTLTRAFDVARVAGLVYRAFSREGEEILLPGLGIDRAPRPPVEPSLAERVDALLRDYLEVEEVSYDSDGDAPIRRDDAVIFVRVVDDPGLVAVFSPVLRGVDKTYTLLDAINEINNEISVARASLTDGTIIIAAEVYEGPGVESSIIHAYEAVASLAETYGVTLQARFGGATSFGEPSTPPATITTGLYL